MLAIWDEPLERDATAEYSRIFVPAIEIADLFDDLFTPIARDGASTVEVGVRLQKAFRTLSLFGRDCFAVNARRHSREALERAEAALAIVADKERLRSLAANVEDGTSSAGLA